MKLEKTREALNLLYSSLVTRESHAAVNDAAGEVEQAESLLREATALKVFAVAGLSAFHGRLCSMAPGAYPENAAEYTDPKCRAWAAVLKGEAETSIPWRLFEYCVNSVGSTSDGEGHAAVWRLYGLVDQRVRGFASDGPWDGEHRDAKTAAIARIERELDDARQELARLQAENAALKRDAAEMDSLRESEAMHRENVRDAALEEAASRCQMYDDAANETARLYGDAFAEAIRALKRGG